MKASYYDIKTRLNRTWEVRYDAAVSNRACFQEAAAGFPGWTFDWNIFWIRNDAFARFFLMFLIFLEDCWLLSNDNTYFPCVPSFKSSRKCLLTCMSSGTRGKIQNLGFFGQKVSKIAIFAKNLVFWRFLTNNFNFCR